MFVLTIYSRRSVGILHRHVARCAEWIVCSFFCWNYFSYDCTLKKMVSTPTVRLGNTNTLRKKGHLFYFLNNYFKRKLSIYSHKVFLFFWSELFSHFYDRLKSHEVVHAAPWSWALRKRIFLFNYQITTIFYFCALK